MEISDNKKLEQDFQSLVVISGTSEVQNESIVKNDGAQKNKYVSNSRKHGLCLYYSKYGYCKYDKSCWFSHSSSTSLSLRKYQLSQNTHCQKKMTKSDKIGGYSEEKNTQVNKNSCENKSSYHHVKKPCRFDAGLSAYDDDFPFDHSIDFCINKLTNVRPAESCKYKDNIRTPKKQSSSVCYFYKRGFCHKGNNCTFFHPKKYLSRNFEANFTAHKFVDVNDDTSKVKNSNEMKRDQPHNLDLNKHSVEVKDFLPIQTPSVRNIYELSSLSQVDNSMLRDTEIKQLKRRFPNHETVEENRVYAFCFQPSDPDWPFDVSNLNVEVQVPDGYPTEICNIAVKQLDEKIPELLIKHLNISISEWLNKRHKDAIANGKVELIFRPFLKWFDRNLEELFISGLRKVKQDIKAKEQGIEFVPPEKLFSKERYDSSNSLERVENSTSLNSEKDLNLHLGIETKKCDIHVKDTLASYDNHFTANECMKIILTNLELTEGAAALNCTKISLTLRCSRCKTHLNVKSERKRSNSYKCLKCNKDIGFTFDPSTVHPFSNILGNLYLMECLPVDINLQDCQLLIDCLNCSKQVATEGVHYGQKHKIWCMFCNQKLVISIESVKFQAAKLSSCMDVKYVPAKKIIKQNKDPVTKEGEPLPNFGACKHYKKSYRWLRFPCCGRLYPCDECHNEKEKDHEMKFASRMICGFCSKEQPYSRDKPCFSCEKNVTKKAGCHWEGGKGCRNKTKMCREDKQKYSGTCKTMSKKAQASKCGKKI